MTFSLDERGINTVFAVPGSSGEFKPDQLAYLQALSSRRPTIVLAFAPKAAGTFLRQAAIHAVDGDLVRIVHAQGGRDAQPYLPTLIGYHSGGVCPGPLIAHVHMQALPANRHFMEALNIRPVIMVRTIPDMLASYWDMLMSDPAARADGLNCIIPSNFPSLPDARKADFLIDVLAPWYASYYGSWFDYASEQPNRVLVLNYASLLDDRVATLSAILSHSGFSKTRAECEAAVEETWNDRLVLRFNQGREGRGSRYFSLEHLEKIARMLAYYPSIGENRDELLFA